MPSLTSQSECLAAAIAAMVVDTSRITGFGSDGSKTKTWTCSKGHLLQPCKATPGLCDGCSAKICKGDSVMDCRQCNFYLCEACHPQENKQEDWFWGPLSYFADVAAQEITEIATVMKDIGGEFEEFASDMSPFAACMAPEVDKTGDIEFPSGGDRRDKTAINRERPAQRKECEERAALAFSTSSSGSDCDGNDFSSNAVMLKKGRGVQRDVPPGQHKEHAKQSEPAKRVPQQPGMVEDLMDIGQHDLLDLDVAFIPAATSGIQQPVSSGHRIFVAEPAQFASFDDLFVGADLPAPKADVAHSLDLFLDLGGAQATGTAESKRVLGLAPPPPPATSLLMM